MAKPPKTDSGKIPQIDDAEVKAAQERLKARIEESKKRDEAREPSKGKDSPDKASPKKAAKPTAPRKPKAQKSGVSIATVALCSLLAAGIGGAIGWLGPQYYNSSDDNAVMAELQSRLTAAEAQIKTQQQRLAEARSDVSAAPDIEGLRAQIRTVSGAVDENAAAIEMAASARSDMAARMDLTEAMLGEEDSVQPNLILERIDAMEAKVTEMAARPSEGGGSKGLIITEPSVISYETAGTAKTAAVSDAATPQGGASTEPPNNAARNKGDVEPASTQAAAALAPTKISDYDFIGNFPRAAMLAAVKSDVAPSESKNWFKRQLDQHMQSGTSEAESARRDIARAEELTKRGDIAGAVELIKGQSPAVQTSAKAWLTAAAAQE